MTPEQAYAAATAETERAYQVWVKAIGLGNIALARRAYFEAMERRRLSYRALGAKAPLPGRGAGAAVADGEHDQRRGMR